MLNDHYAQVATAIRFLQQHHQAQPSLDDIAAYVNLSPSHFQRIFTAWAGISPKKFLQYLTVEALKKSLSVAPNLSIAAEEVGLSTQSRVYDLFVNIEAVTPQTYKTQGKGIEIRYGFGETPFGRCFIAHTEKGICGLSFVDGDEAAVLTAFKSRWQEASVIFTPETARLLLNQIFSQSLHKQSLKLLLQGTKFQIKVWEALLKIPFGQVTHYQHIANTIENPKAVRAVGTAIGQNPIAFLIPCHRVIRREGIIGAYHWGSERKAALLGWEKARQGDSPTLL